VGERTLAQDLAGYAVRVRAAGAPPDVRASVRQRVLDVLGLCVAAQGLPTSRAVLGHVAEQGGRPQASAVGLADPVPAS